MDFVPKHIISRLPHELDPVNGCSILLHQVWAAHIPSTPHNIKVFNYVDKCQHPMHESANPNTTNVLLVLVRINTLKSGLTSEPDTPNPIISHSELIKASLVVGKIPNNTTREGYLQAQEEKCTILHNHLIQQSIAYSQQVLACPHYFVPPLPSLSRS